MVWGGLEKWLTVGYQGGDSKVIYHSGGDGGVMGSCI